jgi:hypothetical protein
MGEFETLFTKKLFFFVMFLCLGLIILMQVTAPEVEPVCSDYLLIGKTEDKCLTLPRSKH